VRVPRFEPFRALRYAPALPLDDVTAPPYDVVSDAEVGALAERHERNVVAVDIPRPEDDPARYEQAGARLRAWEAEGTLVRDDVGSFTLYRTRFVTEAGVARETVGVLGALEVVDEGAGGVLPHERTTPKAKTDRLDLTRATAANLSPVWGLSLAQGLTELLREPATPMGACTDADGVEHRVERVDEPHRAAAIAAAVSSHPVLIADGHHRYAISRTYRDERRADAGPGPWDLTLAYVGELVAEQLSIDAIHRTLHGITAAELRAALARDFELGEHVAVDDAIGAELAARGALCLVEPDGRGTWLSPRPGAFDGVRALDGAWLEHTLGEVLANGVATLGYQHGVRRVVELVRSGAADAAILIRPTSIEEIRRTADEGLLMPPKSTFFAPKLRTGLVIRPM